MSIKTQAKGSFGDLIIIHFLRSFGEPFQKPNNLIENLIFQIREASPLGALDYLLVGAILGGSILQPRMVMGHGWEEHGSSQVIMLSE